MMKIILIVIVVLIVVWLLIYAYYGGFNKFEIRVETQGGETLIYEEVMGDYGQTSRIIDEVYNYLKDNYELKNSKGFGIFLDNPKKVKRNKLRSEVGCILENPDISKTLKLEQDLKIRTLSEAKYIVTEFPLKGTLSIFIGLMKVYPALSSFSQKENYKEEGWIMEIYDIPNKKIIYRKEIVE